MSGGLRAEVSGDGQPAVLIDALGMPKLMGPETVGGDGGKDPLEERLQLVQPGFQLGIGRNHPDLLTARLADFLGGSLWPESPEPAEAFAQVKHPCLVHLGEGLDPAVELVQLFDRRDLQHPVLQPPGRDRAAEPADHLHQVVHGVDPGALLDDAGLDVPAAEGREGGPGEVGNSFPGNCLRLARPAPALMGLKAAITDQRHMGVIVVAVGLDAEVPDHPAAEVLPHIDAVAPRDAADSEAAALDPQLMDALVPGAELADVPLRHLGRWKLRGSLPRPTSADQRLQVNSFTC